MADCVYVFFTVSFSGSLFVPSSLTFCMFGLVGKL